MTKPVSSYATLTATFIIKQALNLCFGSEGEFFEGQGGYFLYFGDKTAEMVGGHVGFEGGFVLPGFVDHEAVSVDEGA